MFWNSGHVSVPPHHLPGSKARKAHRCWSFSPQSHFKFMNNHCIKKTMKLNAMTFPACIRDFNTTLCRTLKITRESHCTKFHGLPETWLTQRKQLVGQIVKESCHYCLPPNEKKRTLGGGLQLRPLKRGSSCKCTHNARIHMIFKVSVWHIWHKS